MSKINYSWTSGYLCEDCSIESAEVEFNWEDDDFQKLLDCRALALSIVDLKARMKCPLTKEIRKELSAQLKTARKEILRYDYNIRFDVKMTLSETQIDIIGTTTWEYGYSARRAECEWMDWN